jgi:MinD-like ATPase involved in chromosome partitioning or flagellar assembly
MNDSTVSPGDSARVEREDSSSGQVLCFVSAKGGTGKTILASTAAYLLQKAGKRVVTIDADFSTRGISLYLLGRIIDSQDLVINPENCLADAVLEGMSVEQVAPRTVRRDGATYNLIFSNQDLWRGGIPDDRFLGVPEAIEGLSENRVEHYFHFLQELCNRLRQEFDYVIIDTRGGYDFTSAVPALVADGYVIVLEADLISIEQIRGFKEKIETYAETFQVRPHLKGFIINKALFSVEDQLFPEEILRLYQAKTFGIVPFDREAVRAYQVKELPVEKYPASDFAHYSFQAIRNLLSPSLNWPEAEAEGFEKLGAHIQALWSGRRRLEWIRSTLPYAQISLVALGTILYLIFRKSLEGTPSAIIYFLLAVFALGTVGGTLLDVLKGLSKTRVGKKGLRGCAVLASLLWLGAIYLAAVDIPDILFREMPVREVRDGESSAATRSEQVALPEEPITQLEAERDSPETEREQQRQDAVIRTREEVKHLAQQVQELAGERDALKKELSLFQSERETPTQQRQMLDSSRRKSSDRYERRPYSADFLDESGSAYALAQLEPRLEEIQRELDELEPEAYLISRKGAIRDSLIHVLEKELKRLSGKTEYLRKDFDTRDGYAREVGVRLEGVIYGMRFLASGKAVPGDVLERFKEIQMDLEVVRTAVGTGTLPYHFDIFLRGTYSGKEGKKGRNTAQLTQALQERIRDTARAVNPRNRHLDEIASRLQSLGDEMAYLAENEAPREVVLRKFSNRYRDIEGLCQEILDDAGWRRK